MRNLQAKFAGFVKKHKIFSIIVAIIITLCLWGAWGQFAPHPLGSKMEYLGKEDYGNILGFDSAPASIYYYGTDMNVDEIAKYFSGTIIENGTTPNNTVEFAIKLPNGETIYSKLYPTIQSKHKTTRKGVLEIPSFKYDTAKKYLAK